jgi:MOSC domain-containing protein YiiM
MNLGVENMQVGTRLQAGTSIVEVSDKFNTACVKWKKRYGDESLRWINMAENRPFRLRGILCKIVQDGVVRVGDRLSKL